jgi:preprotein translocase subunit SecD
MVRLAAILVALMTAMTAARAQLPVAGEPVARFVSEREEFRFSADDVAGIEVEREAGSLTFRLEKTARAMLEAMTVENIGRRVGFVVCGQEVIRPVIRDAIRTGVVRLEGLPAARVQEIADILSGRRNCSG